MALEVMLAWIRRAIWIGGASLLLCACSQGEDKAAKPAQKEAREASAPAQFTEGNLFFLAYHELGHALVSEHELPITGREEDSVDRIAIWMMTPQSADVEPEYLVDAMQGWFSSASRTPLDEIAWWDDHGTGQQRGYQIACLLFGSDPVRYKALAESVDLPKERQETCRFDAWQNDTTWDKLLTPVIRSDAEAAPSEDATITFGPTKTFGAERDDLKEIGLLEHIQELITQHYRFAPGIKILAKECGESNSFWNAETRELTICYELVSDYQDMERS